MVFWYAALYIFITKNYISPDLMFENNVDGACLIPSEAQVERTLKKHLGGVHSDIFKTHICQDLQHLIATISSPDIYGPWCHIRLRKYILKCFISPITIYLYRTSTKSPQVTYIYHFRSVYTHIVISRTKTSPWESFLSCKKQYAHT